MSKYFSQSSASDSSRVIIIFTSCFLNAFTSGGISPPCWIFFWIFLAWISGDPFYPYPPRTYLLFLLLALVPQLIGHTSLNWALKFFSATLVALLILGEPIGATLLACLLLDEPLTLKLFAGGALVLAGIYFAAREQKKSI